MLSDHAPHYDTTPVFEQRGFELQKSVLKTVEIERTWKRGKGEIKLKYCGKK
jgi:hypothetical protein